VAAKNNAQALVSAVTQALNDLADLKVDAAAYEGQADSAVQQI